MSAVSTPPSSRWRFWLAGLFVLALLVAAGLNASTLLGRAADKDEERPAIPAPDFEGGAGWLNTASPIRIKDLKGKIVLLDFWTFCCINCIHTLPDLKKLEKKYTNQLVVVGVHSAKFDNEKDTEAIRKAVLRYEIEHPVVNDPEMRIWKSYRASAWPTIVLIDPEGNLYARGSGEGLFEALDEEITKLIEKHRKKKTLNEKPIKFELARFSETGNSPLFFPGKVLADQQSNRLFIADSTHHRIVITTLDGKKIAVAGIGKPAHTDGAFDKAAFDDPQGMAVKGDLLYVADRRNHVIRELDLKRQKVRTIAGTGKQGEDRRAGGKPTEVGLNSPWDLLLQGDDLYIAMAGFHQIWKLDLKNDDLQRYAGVGPENIRDGKLLTRAFFAQPSGLATDGKNIYVADSEVSAIRSLPLGANADSEVTTLVGEGLFEFGDTDGTGDKVRLQHALGVAVRGGKLYIADTYNSKIKILDPATKECKTFLGGQSDGWVGGPLFLEPGGLSFAGDRLYVADTNAHRIRVIDMKAKKVSTLTLDGVEAPKVQ